MTPKHLFFVLLTGLVVTIAAMGGAAYGITGLLHTKSTQLAGAKASVAQYNAQQTGLSKSKTDIAHYSSLEQITKSIVPQDKDQAETVREITNIASANRIPLTTITFPSSTLGSTANGTPAAAASAAALARPNLSQLSPVKGIPGVYNLQITLGNNANNSVTFNQLDSFLRSLENNRRTAAVSSISIQPQPDQSNQYVFTLVINTYIKPS